jgi:hypothetical protein
MIHNFNQFDEFTAYVYVDNAGCYLNGVEFGISPLPAGIFYDGFTVPAGSLWIGDPVTQGGVAITYFPPLNGYFPGYNELCKLHYTAEEDWCECGTPSGGHIINQPLRVVPHIETGAIRGACFPEGNLINFVGLTSTLCPYPISVKSRSWGAIKSLF